MMQHVLHACACPPPPYRTLNLACSSRWPMRAISLAASRGSLVLNCCSAAPRCDWLRQCLSRWCVRCAGSIESHDCWGAGTGPAACCVTVSATGTVSSVLQLSRLPLQLTEASAMGAAGRMRGGCAAAAAASAAQAAAEGGAAQAGRLLHCMPAARSMGAGRVRASIRVAVRG